LVVGLSQRWFKMVLVTVLLLILAVGQYAIARVADLPPVKPQPARIMFTSPQSLSQGMQMLTIAKALRARGHQVELWGNAKMRVSDRILHSASVFWVEGG
jgi:hypothetical protein